MATRAEHRAKAERAIDGAFEMMSTIKLQVETGEITKVDQASAAIQMISMAIALGQVHATLALSADPD